MSADTVVRARIDTATKERASAAAIRLPVSDAIRLLMLRIADEQRLPFEVKVPTTTTRRAIAELEQGKGKRFDSADALFKDLDIQRPHPAGLENADADPFGPVPPRREACSKARQGHKQGAPAHPAAPGRGGLAGTLQPHPLKSRWKGYRDAHIEPDWLLIYRVVDDELHLVRTGTHAVLFDR